MNRVSQNEQWKLQGDCDKCRRDSYCSKPCTRCKRANKARMNRLVAEAMDTMTGGAMREIVHKTVKGIY